MHSLRARSCASYPHGLICSWYWTNTKRWLSNFHSSRLNFKVIVPRNFWIQIFRFANSLIWNKIIHDCDPSLTWNENANPRPVVRALPSATGHVSRETSSRRRVYVPFPFFFLFSSADGARVRFPFFFPFFCFLPYFQFLFFLFFFSYLFQFFRFL